MANNENDGDVDITDDSDGNEVDQDSWQNIEIVDDESTADNENDQDATITDGDDNEIDQDTNQDIENVDEESNASNDNNNQASIDGSDDNNGEE